MVIREFKDEREAVLNDPRFIAEQEWMERHRQEFLNSERGKEYLKRDPAKREELLRKLEAEGRLMDPVEAFMRSPSYIAEKEWKERHRQAYLKSERFLKSERGQEYLRQQQAEQDSE